MLLSSIRHPLFVLQLVVVFLVAAWDPRWLLSTAFTTSPKNARCPLCPPCSVAHFDGPSSTSSSSSSSRPFGFLGHVPNQRRSIKNDNIIRRYYMNRQDDLRDNVAIDEILLCVQLSRFPFADLSTNQTYQLLLEYTQSFPFAAVLPVQPLTYLPTNKGVQVQFLRKKTVDKPSVDGGINIMIESQPSSPLVEYEDDETTTAVSVTPTEPLSSWTITAKRNSDGQSISKMFAEKLIVQAYLDGLTGKSQQYVTTGSIQPRDVVEVTSVYHKWMSERR